MEQNKLPLEEISIEELFKNNTYEIPIYQRNYAWEKEEITALVQDIYDAYKKNEKRPYYIGTLVTHHKSEGVFEIIDGQQRLTTLSLMLVALVDGWSIKQLTYSAREKAKKTLEAAPKFFDIEDKDSGIENGYKYVTAAIGAIVENNKKESFKSYLKKNVRIIHYQVPKDIDLNHYFEVMNSRGEQLEKHEIVKATLMSKLGKDDGKVFAHIWDRCAEMGAYIQQNLQDINLKEIFGEKLDTFNQGNFDSVLAVYGNNNQTKKNDNNKEERNHPTKDEKKDAFLPIIDIIKKEWEQPTKAEKKDAFLPIIDFPNFLLIVLKITRMEEADFSPEAVKRDDEDFILDDKELINEFDKIKENENKIKKFAYNLLKARFFLDNFIVHHSKEEEKMDSNPWKLEKWKGGEIANLADEDSQNRLVHLLSMFEVTYSARQRKNYLFYCLYYLMKNYNADDNFVKDYAAFVENLAYTYLHNIYLNEECLSENNNTPSPGSFDKAILEKNIFIDFQKVKSKNENEFSKIYGDGKEKSKGIPLFVFNYLDYRLWKLYEEKLRGKEFKEGNDERKAFFEKLGCSDFGLAVFDRFYFSRTRNSLEHFYPQANAKKDGPTPNEAKINCFGNFAMIGSRANSSGSNWDPITKVGHYLDDRSGKINQVSVASLKFRIMMQMCKNNENKKKKPEWGCDEIKAHQAKMVSMLTAPISQEELGSASSSS